MKEYTLLLLIDGVFQSWDCTSRFSDKRAGDLPTKSGIIGMILNAFGVERKNIDQNLLEQLNSLNMGIRILKNGKTNAEFRRVIKRNTIYTVKYQTGSVYLVGLSSNDLAFLSECFHALKKPKRPLYLGRKEFLCSPSLVQNLIEDSIVNALMDYKFKEFIPRGYEFLDKAGNQDKNTRIYLDADYNIDQIAFDKQEILSFYVSDNVRSFSPFDRKYSSRRVKLINITKNNELNDSVMESSGDDEYENM